MKNKNYPNKSEQKVGLAFEKLGVEVVYQHPCGPYSLDVFLPKYNACVEIDGPHHVVKGRQVSDQIRQRYIEEQGISVYTIRADEANVEHEVNRLVKRVMEEARIPKPKKVESFNDMKDQLAKWMDVHGAPESPADPPPVTPKKSPLREDFGTMLERYLPEKQKSKKNGQHRN